MSGLVGALEAAASGSTGNTTHTGVQLSPAGKHVALVFVVEAIGAGPTVTFKLQGTLDGPLKNDASAGWFDLMLLPSASETAVATDTKTGLGSYAYYLAQAHTRFARRVRVVTSANTNVTYRAEIYQLYSN